MHGRQALGICHIYTRTMSYLHNMTLLHCVNVNVNEHLT